MKNATRFLMTVGAGVLTSAVMAVPAQAAPSDNPVPVAQVQRDRDRGWEFEGEFDSRRVCNWAGERGERRHKWDDYKCVERRGDYRLYVRDDDHRGPWGNRDDDKRGPGGNRDNDDRGDNHGDHDHDR